MIFILQIVRRFINLICIYILIWYPTLLYRFLIKIVIRLIKFVHDNYFLFHLRAFNANMARFLVSGFFEWVNSSVVLPVLFFVALNFPRFAGFICMPDLP
nr:MAG TPA: hypothetical protein [Caudoviricetes sp.]